MVQHILLSMIFANVGLDPAKDINWVFHETRDPEELFAAARSMRSWPIRLRRKNSARATSAA